jgi:hypothetical protein
MGVPDHFLLQLRHILIVILKDELSQGGIELEDCSLLFKAISSLLLFLESIALRELELESRYQIRPCLPRTAKIEREGIHSGGVPHP